TEPLEPVYGALIAILLDDHRIITREQHAVDQVKRLQRARHDQDIVRRAGDGGIALELAGDEFPQRPITLRSTLEAVIRKRRAFAREHGGRPRREAVGWDLRRIIVAAA